MGWKDSTVSNLLHIADCKSVLKPHLFPALSDSKEPLDVAPNQNNNSFY